MEMREAESALQRKMHPSSRLKAINPLQRRQLYTARHRHDHPRHVGDAPARGGVRDDIACPDTDDADERLDRGDPRSGKH